MSNKKKGDFFEEISHVIQEAYKDIPQTTIKIRHKVQNKSGNLREFDIWVESIVNNYKIVIAIECKNYDEKIPVGQVEAFESKCKRVEGINKKIFISSKGFQKDGIDAAKEFDISLFTLEKISKEEVTSWINTEELYFLDTILKIKLPLSIILIPSDKKLNFDIRKMDLILHFSDEPTPIIAVELVEKVIKSKIASVRNYLLKKFFSSSNKTTLEGIEEVIEFNLDLKGSYIIDEAQQKFEIQSIKGEVLACLEIANSTNLQISEYSDLDKDKKLAQVVSVDLSEKKKISLVKKLETNETKVLISLNNKVHNLKLIGQISPETKDVIIIE